MTCSKAIQYPTLSPLFVKRERYNPGARKTQERGGPSGPSPAEPGSVLPPLSLATSFSLSSTGPFSKYYKFP